MALWTMHSNGKTLGPGEVVAPDQRLTWPRTFPTITCVAHIPNGSRKVMSTRSGSPQSVPRTIPSCS